MNVTACIVGINEWERYTLPLVKSIQKHEPSCEIVVIDNESEQPYPNIEGAQVFRTARCCYAKALNTAAAASNADWYVFLSNDVLCTGPFIEYLRQVPPGFIAGPQVVENLIYRYVMGWCMCVPRHVWQAVGEFDENFQLSAWEDTDYSWRVLNAGMYLGLIEDFPFLHLDQQQRNRMGVNHYHIWNGAYFERKHKIPRPLLRYSPAGLVGEQWM